MRFAGNKEQGMARLTAEVAQHGTITLPKSLRDQYGITTGKKYTIIDLGGVFVLSPREPHVNALCNEIREELLDAGASLEEMLAELRRMREADGPVSCTPPH